MQFNRRVVLVLGVCVGLCWAAPLEAQVRCQVRATDGSPIGYVRVLDTQGRYGFLADSLGWFTLPRQLEAADSLVCSAIGYASSTVSVAALRLSPEVRLAEQAITLATAQIVGSRGKVATQGRERTSGVVSFVYQLEPRREALPEDLLVGGPVADTFGVDTSGYRGGEFGIPLRVDGPTWLRSVQVYFLQNTFDTLRFRLHVYAQTPEGPGTDLLPREVRFDVTDQLEGWQTFDFQHLGFEVAADCLVTLEILEHTSAHPTPLLTIPGTVSVGSSSWVKRRVGAGWRHLRVVPSFYVELYQ